MLKSLQSYDNELHYSINFFEELIKIPELIQFHNDLIRYYDDRKLAPEISILEKPFKIEGEELLKVPQIRRTLSVGIEPLNIEMKAMKIPFHICAAIFDSIFPEHYLKIIEKIHTQDQTYLPNNELFYRYQGIIGLLCYIYYKMCFNMTVPYDPQLL